MTVNLPSGQVEKRIIPVEILPLPPPRTSLIPDPLDMGLKKVEQDLGALRKEVETKLSAPLDDPLRAAEAAVARAASLRASLDVPLALASVDVAEEEAEEEEAIEEEAFVESMASVAASQVREHAKKLALVSQRVENAALGVLRRSREKPVRNENGWMLVDEDEDERRRMMKEDDGRKEEEEREGRLRQEAIERECVRRREEEREGRLRQETIERESMRRREEEREVRLRQEAIERDERWRREDELMREEERIQQEEYHLRRLHAETARRLHLDGVAATLAELDKIISPKTSAVEQARVTASGIEGLLESLSRPIYQDIIDGCDSDDDVLPADDLSMFTNPLEQWRADAQLIYVDDEEEFEEPM